MTRQTNHKRIASSTNIAIDLQRASDLLRPANRSTRPTQKPSHGLHYAVELTVGVDPKQLVREAVLKVRDSGLQTFMKKLVQEPDVLPLLVQRMHSKTGNQRPAIQFLRAAGETVQYGSAMGRDEQEVLYVATLVLGIQTLMADCIVGDATPRDVMFTIVRPHLYQLENDNPRCASLLRQCLGWCNEDEVDGEYVPRLQSAVQRAVHSMYRYSQSRSVRVLRNAAHQA